MGFLSKLGKAVRPAYHAVRAVAPVALKVAAPFTGPAAPALYAASNVVQNLNDRRTQSRAQRSYEEGIAAQNRAQAQILRASQAYMDRQLPSEASHVNPTGAVSRVRGRRELRHVADDTMTAYQTVGGISGSAARPGATDPTADNVSTNEQGTPVTQAGIGGGGWLLLLLGAAIVFGGIKKGT